MSAFEFILAAMIVVGSLVIALAVYGLITMPFFAARLQSASLAVYLGTGLIVLAAMIAVGRDVAEHGVLILLILLITSPIATHSLIQAEVKQDARANQPDVEANQRNDTVSRKPDNPNPENPPSNL